MNSRSSVNETNLVNLSENLSTPNQLDTKQSLLSFPFDHIYACHSASSNRIQTLHLEKEVEITTHCVVEEEKDLVVNTSVEITRLTEKLSAAENQNKKLKDLLIHHLDLIQQQNELINKKEKLNQALKQENATLKIKVNQKERKITVNQRHNLTNNLTVVNQRQNLSHNLTLVNQRHNITPTSLVHVATPTTTVTSTVVKSEPGTSSQMMYNSLTELFCPDDITNPYLFNNDISKPKPFNQDSYSLTRTTESGVSTSSMLDRNINCDNFTMIENKRSFIKKEIKTENRPEPLYTVTSNSGIPVIQKIQRSRRRTSAGIGSLSRMSKPIKVEFPENTKMLEDEKCTDPFNVNKKSKMISTYNNFTSTVPKRHLYYTGSLVDRLKLIDTTPTGEDPYQLGEAEMREQSPIPKLMLQKSKLNRSRTATGSLGETPSNRRIYDMPATETSTNVSSKIKLEKDDLSNTFMHTEIKKEGNKTLIVHEPDLDIVKTEPEIDWRIYDSNEQGNDTRICDYSYGENSNNFTSQLMPSLDEAEFRQFFNDETGLNLDTLNNIEFNPVNDNPNDSLKIRGTRVTSLIEANMIRNETADTKRGSDSKRGRKRALSTTGCLKGGKPLPQKAVSTKPKIMRGRGACRGKRPSVPGMMTKKRYHTLVGDPDLSWYLGLDPELKKEDIDQPVNSMISTVEVPRWREKPYTSSYTLEGTENLDEKVYEKRHQKLEAEERRQLRWHMRRIREQKHVERLRLRHRDSWCRGSSALARHHSIYTIWPQPQQDARLIEITDILPVMAFGEILPDLPRADFMLPWVRISKALKRSKRSKTLH